MLDRLLDPPILLYIALALGLAGAIARSQLVLRALTGAAALVALVHFASQPTGTDWGLVLLCGALLSAHAIRAARLALDRRDWSLSEDERGLMRSFGTLTVGEFRQLLRGAKWFTAAADTMLTREGEIPANLYYVATGIPRIDKNGQSFEVEGGLFIGEISWLLGQPATASVSLPAGARYLAWDGAVLRDTLDDEPSLKAAMSTILNRDLARKLGRN